MLVTTNSSQPLLRERASVLPSSTPHPVSLDLFLIYLSIGRLPRECQRRGAGRGWRFCLPSSPLRPQMAEHLCDHCSAERTSSY